MNAIIHSKPYAIDMDCSDEPDGTRMSYGWDGETPSCPACGELMETCRVSYDPPTASKSEPTPFVVCDSCEERIEVKE